jgi:hypothetical protein
MAGATEAGAEGINGAPTGGAVGEAVVHEPRGQLLMHGVLRPVHVLRGRARYAVSGEGDTNVTHMKPVASCLCMAWRDTFTKCDLSMS